MNIGLRFAPKVRCLFQLTGQTAPVSCVLVNHNPNRPFSRKVINKNLELWSPEPKEIDSSAVLNFGSDQRPLTILLSWLMSNKKHLAKYANIYFKRGCDVLTVTITPWQLIWPVTGTQIVADNIIDFLYPQYVNRPILMHGFSVGGYLWGEVLVKMNQDLKKYQPLIDQVRGQTWDSAADITEIQRGLPFAMFPRNKILRTTLEKYIGYHLKTFNESATRHYVRSSQMFHTTLIRAPALFFVSKADFIGPPSSNMKVKESWDSMGMMTYWKCWEKSRHVSHMAMHREEYLSILDSFLKSVEISSSEEMKKNVRLKL